MADIAIVLMASVSCIVFIISLTLVIRAKGQSKILVSIKTSYLTLLGIGSSILWLILGNMMTVEKMGLLLVFIILFSAICFSYTLIVFGTSITSVRIQFLINLLGYGDRGANIKRLMKDYSKESLIRIRLHRLETSGEVIRRGAYYSIKSRWSYFMVHNYFLLFLINLYSPLPRR